MMFNETFARIKALWNTGDNRPYSDAERGEIENLYIAVFGRQIRTCNCSEKWRDAVIEMYFQLKNNRKMHEKSNYILKAGVVIQPDGTSTVYNNNNLTDEVAAEFLKKCPNAAGLFERIPDTPAGDNGGSESPENGQIADISNESVRNEIAAALESGETKTKIKSDFVGREIDGVKLTKRLIAAYIKAIETTENE